MKKVLLGILSASVGMLVAGVAVGAIQSLNLLLYPELSRAAAEDPSSLRVADVPTGAMIVVLIAFCVGAAIGSFVAAWLTTRLVGRRSLLPPYGFGILFLLACLGNFLTIPHPMWMSVLGIVAPAAIVMATSKATLRAFPPRTSSRASSKSNKAPPTATPAVNQPKRSAATPDAADEAGDA